MGVAAISVLIGHAGTAIMADTGAILLVPKMATLICIKKVLLPYLGISSIAYAIKYFILEFSVRKFIEAEFFISFWVKNEGAWYIAVVLVLYVVYPVLYNIQKSTKGKKL